MNKLYLQGYLVMDDEMICVKENNKKFEYPINIAKEIMKFAKEYGYCKDYNDNLGGTISMINNAKIHIYITDKKTSYEEATLHLLEKLYGNVYNNIENIGYSEYTIIGLRIKDLNIGGHDLVKELKSHIGEYVHFVLECP